MWLVKWLLAIPHLIIIAFLWIALLVLTVVAFFAILITARYPRSIFDFKSACCDGLGACSFPLTPSPLINIRRSL
jgi:hypothetical protein